METGTAMEEDVHVDDHRHSRIRHQQHQPRRMNLPSNLANPNRQQHSKVHDGRQQIRPGRVQAQRFARLAQLVERDDAQRERHAEPKVREAERRRPRAVAPAAPARVVLRLLALIVLCEDGAGYGEGQADEGAEEGSGTEGLCVGYRAEFHGCGDGVVWCGVMWCGAMRCGIE
jgi:hypothetical protein